METTDTILTLAVMLGAGLVARVAADRLRLPEMLLLLAAGVVVGPEALAWADVPLKSDAAQVLLTLGVSFILFHGGFGLSVRVLERTAVGLVALAIPGVVITAAVAGMGAAWLFGVDLLVGLLIGAVLAPTDPAILVPLFARLKMRPKVAQTAIAESALNDPTGAVLALALAAAVMSGGASIPSVAWEFVVEVAISVVLGGALGVALALVVSSRASGIWRESSTLAVVAAVGLGYVGIDAAGGSGYLGAFLAGVIVGNMGELRHRMQLEHKRELETSVGALSDTATILVFVLLGSQLPWGALGEHWASALGVVAVLLFIARPLTVALCLLPDRRSRWTRSELVFLGWTRETGVVPTALAGILIAKGVEGAELAAVCVALALVVTVGLQATTKPWLARRLGLLDD